MSDVRDEGGSDEEDERKHKRETIQTILQLQENRRVVPQKSDPTASTTYSTC